MKTMFVFLLCLTGLQAHAAGAQRYSSLKQAIESKFYRLTCSDKSAIEAHVYAEVINSNLTNLKIVTISPAESLKVLEFSARDLTGMKVVEAVTTAQITGNRSGAYFDEEFDLVVEDKGQSNISATLYFDDHDGMVLRRVLTCGAVNYILSPHDY